MLPIWYNQSCLFNKYLLQPADCKCMSNFPMNFIGSTINEYALENNPSGKTSDSSFAYHGENVLLVSYYDDNILSYSSYSMDLLQYYALLHNHSTMILNPNSSFSVMNNLGSDNDARWEKVHLLLHLFKEEQQYTLYDYIIWVDADIIMMNYGDNTASLFDDLIYTYPSYDIIISAEYHAETGVANTGCFIIKCTKWSQQFINKWWAQDHNRGHDQVLFDVLYKSLLPDVKMHIKILPANVLNTIPPAYLFLGSSDSILHLMGERADLRADIFSRALSLVCNHICVKGHNTPLQLQKEGLDRQFIAEKMISLSEVSIPQILLEMSDSANAIMKLRRSLDCFQAQTTLNSIINKASEVRELLLQHSKILKAAQQNKDFNYLSIESKRIQWQKSIYYLLKQVLSELYISVREESCSSLITLKLQLINLIALIGNDLNQDLIEVLQKERGNTSEIQSDISIIYEEVGWHLEWLLSLVETRSTSFTAVLSMQALHLQNQARFCFLGTGTSFSADAIYRCLELFELSLSKFQTIESVDSTALNKFQRVGVLQQYADAACATWHAMTKFAERSSFSARVLDAYSLAIDSWKELLYAEEQWKEDHDHLRTTLEHAIRCFSLESAISPRLDAETISAHISNWEDNLVDILNLKHDSRGRAVSEDQGSDPISRPSEVLQAPLSTSDTNYKTQTKRFKKVKKTATK